MKKRNLVTGIYYHPEAYPPTLNAIGECSRIFDRIAIVHRAHLKGAWKYPANVEAIASGNYISSTGQESASTPKKIGFFLTFVKDLLAQCLKLRPSVILLYDANALYAYKLIRPFLFFKHRLWYHNHDISEIETLRKYSIGWLACRAEKKIFHKISIFTLPSAERLSFFPMDRFQGEYFVIPNYPSLDFYGPFYKKDKPMEEIKLVFQGRIGPGHGLEEIIRFLDRKIREKPLRLVLKGHISKEYKDSLLNLAKTHGVEDRLSFIGFTPYEEVPRVAAECHIGIGIFSHKEVMHVTLGTASNKLYEYAAVGLPVIYLPELHFSRYLEKYEWAIPVELSPEGIKRQIEMICEDYDRFSSAAHASFQKELNFQHYFQPVADWLKQKM